MEPSGSYGSSAFLEHKQQEERTWLLVQNVQMLVPEAQKELVMMCIPGMTTNMIF